MYEAYLIQNNEHKIDILKRNTYKGLPCGSDEFITRLSKKIGKNLRFKNIGRPKKW